MSKAGRDMRLLDTKSELGHAPNSLFIPVSFGVGTFSFSKKRAHFLWWGRLGSNQRPSGYEPPALTPELRPQELDLF